MISYILAIVAGLAVLGADQWTKVLAAKELAADFGSKTLIPGILDLAYVENGGGAWGILQDRTWLLLSVTAIIMLICVALLIKYGVENKVLFWAICLVLSGGIGNMIDRIFRGGKVVDFLSLSFMDFPVFNVADCAVCVGAGLLVLYFVLGMIRDEREKKSKLNRMAADFDSKTGDVRIATDKIHVSEQTPAADETDFGNGGN